MDEVLAKPKILFVDDEINVIDGIKRMLYPYKKDWDLYFTYGGIEALEILEKTPINIIISDMRMPLMNGADLLTRVQEKYPEVIRIILSGHSDEELILKTVNVAHQFLTKPCSLEILVETIKKLFLLRVYLTNDNLLKIINGVEELPKIPELYLKLEKELNAENVSMNKIVNMITEDVSLSSKILQLVNSAFFGLPMMIADLDSAVNLLGINTIKSLLLFLKFQTNEYRNISSSFSLEQFFAHSTKVAKTARLIYQCESKDIMRANEAYSAGLLHDIGKLILLKYPGYFEIFQNKNGIPLHKREYDALKVSHAEVGAYLLGLWNLPKDIMEAVALHHKPEEMTSFSFKAVIYYANLLVSNVICFNDLNVDPAFREKIEKWQTVVKDV